MANLLSSLGLGASSIGGFVTDSLSAGLNQLFNRSNMAKQQEYNMEMLNAQNEFTEHMFDKAAAYSSPTAQRQRLIDAGLNPILVGQMNGNTASAMSSGSGGGSSALGSTAAFQNPIMVEKQAELLDSQKNKNNADAEAARANVPLTESQTKAQEMANEIREKTKTEEITKNKHELTALAVKYYNDEAVQEIWRNTLNDGDFRNEVAESQMASIRSIIQTYINLKSQKELNDATIQNMRDQIAVTIMGIKAGVESSKILAAVQKYGHDMQYKGLLARIAADKDIAVNSVERLFIDFIKETGAYDAFKNWCKKFHTNNPWPDGPSNQSSSGGGW